MKRATLWFAWLVAGVGCLTIANDVPQNQLKEFMQVKLKYSQNVLEALLVEDYDTINKNAQELSLLSLAATWQVLTTPEYVEYSRKFRNAADSMSAAAKKSDLDATTEAFNLVTSRCVECHKYVRGVRVAANPHSESLPASIGIGQ